MSPPLLHKWTRFSNGTNAEHVLIAEGKVFFTEGPYPNNPVWFTRNAVDINTGIAPPGWSTPFPTGADGYTSTSALGMDLGLNTIALVQIGHSAPNFDWGFDNIPSYNNAVTNRVGYHGSTGANLYLQSASASPGYYAHSLYLNVRQNTRQAYVKSGRHYGYLDSIYEEAVRSFDITTGLDNRTPFSSTTLRPGFMFSADSITGRVFAGCTNTNGRAGLMILNDTGTALTLAGYSLFWDWNLTNTEVAWGAALTPTFQYLSNMYALGPAVFSGGFKSCIWDWSPAGNSAVTDTQLVQAASGDYHTIIRIYDLPTTSAGVLTPKYVFDEGNYVSGHTVVANGSAYFVDYPTGEVFSLSLATGAETWRSTPYPGIRIPSAIGEHTLIAAGGGLMVAFGPSVPPPPPPPVVSAQMVSFPTCLTGYGNMPVAIDSAFVNGNGPLADAVIAGYQYDYTGAAVNHWLLRYDPSANTWNSVTPMVTPANTCSGDYAQALVLESLAVASNAPGAMDVWSLGLLVGYGQFNFVVDDAIWHLSGGAWTGPTYLPNHCGANLWSPPKFLAVIRGTTPPVTAWTSYGQPNVGVPWGTSFFNGFSWSPLTPIDGGTYSARSIKISFPYGDASHGWMSLEDNKVAYLDVAGYPAPGAWVVDPQYSVWNSPITVSSLHVASANDIWLCGLSYPGTMPSIMHTTGPGVAPVAKTVFPAPGANGDPANYPTLLDITFNEVPADSNKGVAVGGCWVVPPDGTGPIVYVTHDSGATWTYVPVTVPANYRQAMLRSVRFVGPSKAYAIGFAVNGVTGQSFPFMVEVNL